MSLEGSAQDASESEHREQTKARILAAPSACKRPSHVTARCPNKGRSRAECTVYSPAAYTCHRPRLVRGRAPPDRAAPRQQDAVRTWLVCPWSFVTRPWPSATGPQCPQGRSVWPGWVGLVSRVPHGGLSLWFCDSISIGPSRRTRSCSLLDAVCGKQDASATRCVQRCRSSVRAAGCNLNRLEDIVGRHV
jgi:hypothetical protein